MPKGYYMEFGVLNGECMIDAYRQFRGHISLFYGFDSFEGLPELSADDQKALKLTPMLHKGNFKSMKIHDVRNVITSSSQMQNNELTLVQGLFHDVLPKYDKEVLKQVGIPLCIYVDCDLYSSTIDVLNFVGDLAVTGTWILFDDYWCYRGSPQYGQQKAVREWIKDNSRIGLSEYCNFNGWGKAFIVYEK